MGERTSRHVPISEDMTFQRAWWVAERAFWLVIALVMVLAIAGVFAGGFASVTVVGDGTPLAARYERFQRVTKSTEYRLLVAAEAADEISLRISPPFSETYEIGDVEPRPLRSTANPDALALFFARPAAGPLHVTLYVKPRRIGAVSFTAQSDNATAQFQTFIYP